MNDTSCLFPPEAAAKELNLTVEEITRHLRKGTLTRFADDHRTLITADSMRALEKQLDAEAYVKDTAEYSKRRKIKDDRLEQYEKAKDRRYLRDSIRRQVIAERELKKDLAVRREVEKRLKAMDDKKEAPEMVKRRTL